VKILTFLLAILPGMALAGTLAGNLSAPTQNTDGSTIPASGTGSLTGARLEYGTCATTGANPTFGTKAGEITVAPTATTWSVPNLNPGTYCVRGYWKNTFGNESSASNAVSGPVNAPTPNPGTLTVSIPTVYTVIKSRDRFVALPVGTVPLGTVCDSSQPILAYHVVPVSKVTWTGSARPEAVVAKCS
jgi:hypothetical protein